VGGAVLGRWGLAFLLYPYSLLLLALALLSLRVRREGRGPPDQK
jgi:hypothetical protein